MVVGRLHITNGLAVAAALLLAGAGCAGPGAAAAVSGVAGIYSGSTTNYRYPGPVVSTPRRIFGAVGSGGNGYFISVSATGSDIRVFRHLDALGKVTSPEYEVPVAGRAVARGARNWKIAIMPAGSDSFRLEGKFNRVDGYAALTLQMQPLTGRHISLARESGAYRGVDVNRGTTAAITLDSTGHIAGTDAVGCRISGQLTPVAKLNLFDAGVTFAGPSACRGAMTGVAFFGTRDRTGQLSGAARVYLYVIGTNGDFDHGFAMVLSHRSG